MTMRFLPAFLIATTTLTAASATAQVRSQDPNVVQKAWSNPEANKAQNQLSPGYSRHDFVADKIIRLTLREAMNTTIRFPAEELIEDLFVSDPVSFEAVIPRSNVVIVRVIRPGTDGNIVAFGKSGRLYQFYVRGEDTKSTKITDIMVDIMARGNAGGLRAASGPLNMAGVSRSTSAADLAVEADWLRRIGFRPENIVHDLSIRIPEGDSAGVVPERVFRDNQFTYIDYGANADALNEWPVAALVVQGVETPVNVRTAGPNGRMLVVEGVGDITLRNGMKVVCIKQSSSPRIPQPPVRPPVRATLDVTNVQTAAATGTATPPPVASPANQRRYMIDLGSGQRATLEKTWLTLKAQHAPLLGNTQASFPEATLVKAGGSTKPAAPGDLRLRAGPFFGLSEGVAACRAITATGASCAIVADQ